MIMSFCYSLFYMKIPEREITKQNCLNLFYYVSWLYSNPYDGPPDVNSIMFLKHLNVNFRNLLREM